MTNFIAFLLVLLLFSGNTIYTIEQFRSVAPIQYLRGHVSRDQYIEKFRPEYAAIRHANDALPSDAVILSLFIGRRGYYSEREMFFDIDPFHTVIEKSNSAEELRAKLADRGLTHLLIRFDMFDNWLHNNLDGNKKQIVIDFISDKTIFLFAKNGHGLYQLL